MQTSFEWFNARNLMSDPSDDHFTQEALVYALIVFANHPSDLPIDARIYLTEHYFESLTD